LIDDTIKDHKKNKEDLTNDDYSEAVIVKGDEINFNVYEGKNTSEIVAEKIAKKAEKRDPDAYMNAVNAALEARLRTNGIS
jgi:hypothetical protein